MYMLGLYAAGDSGEMTSFDPTLGFDRTQQALAGTQGRGLVQRTIARTGLLFDEELHTDCAQQSTDVHAGECALVL